MDTQDKIKELIKNGATQTDIEKNTEISQATISRILNGRHQRIKKSTKEKINALYESVFTEISHIDAA